MPKLAKILLIALIILVVLGLLFAGWLWLTRRKTIPVGNTNDVTPIVDQPVENNNLDNQAPTNINTYVPPAADDKTIAEERVRRFAMFFTEKFGTYSSQGDFENFKELFGSMTPKMKSWAESQINSKWRLQDPYSGVTTRALRAQITAGSITDDQIQVVVDTQREKRVGASSEIVYEALRLELVKSAGGWLADGAFWQ